MTHCLSLCGEFSSGNQKIIELFYELGGDPYDYTTWVLSNPSLHHPLPTNEDPGCGPQCGLYLQNTPGLTNTFTSDIETLLPGSIDGMSLSPIQGTVFYV